LLELSEKLLQLFPDGASVALQNSSQWRIIELPINQRQGPESLPLMIC